MTELGRNPLFIFAVLSLLVFLAEWMARQAYLRHLGAALLVIILGAMASNLGIIPSDSPGDAPVAIYDVIFATIAPIAIFWLLLSVNLRDVLRAGLPLLALFFVGAAGTMLGVIVGMRLVNGAAAIGPHYQAIAGMFSGTYTGGSVNFNALALHYDVVREGLLYGGAVVVDNILTAAWIVATLAIPRGLAVLWMRRMPNAAVRTNSAPIVDLAAESETLDPRKLAMALLLGAGGLLVAQMIARGLEGVGLSIPPILIITALALVLAQVPQVSRLPGPRVLAMYAVYLFLAVIGAFCDLRALGELGTLGVVLMVFATTTVLVHGAITFGAAWLFRMDLESAAVVSQANVGGSTSALALAKSLGREDLLVPGILLGTVGNAVGTFLGFAVARMV